MYCLQGEGIVRGSLGGHVHYTAIFKWITNKGIVEHMDFSVVCGSLDGKGVWRSRCVYMYEAVPSLFTCRVVLMGCTHFGKKVRVEKNKTDGTTVVRSQRTFQIKNWLKTKY